MGKNSLDLISIDPHTSCNTESREKYHPRPVAVPAGENRRETGVHFGYLFAWQEKFKSQNPRKKLSLRLIEPGGDTDEIGQATRLDTVTWFKVLMALDMSVWE
jgi:hypothetical protein